MKRLEASWRPRSLSLAFCFFSQRANTSCTFVDARRYWKMKHSGRHSICSKYLEPVHEEQKQSKQLQTISGNNNNRSKHALLAHSKKKEANPACNKETNCYNLCNIVESTSEPFQPASPFCSGRQAFIHLSTHSTIQPFNQSGRRALQPPHSHSQLMR